MATKARSTGSRAGGRGGNVSLADEDRQYLNESLNKARGRVGNTQLDEGSVFEALERFGLGSERVERLRTAISDLEVRESIDKASEFLAEQIENARDYTRDNPKKVIGGAAGVLVGASLLALAIRRAAGEEKRSRAAAKGGAASPKTSSTKSTSSKKGSKKSAKSSSSKKSSSSRKPAKRR
ncbi:MAG TPA: hypothetical protein VFT12_10900 [Thermoanaerobaculia bacterium]|nr:hypothetical protein [Thermoanaerobaculia bacterium]